MQWDQLLDYHLTMPEKALSRDIKIEEQYENHKRNLTQQGIKIGDYLANKLFPDRNITRKYVITENEFPYSLDSNIVHLVFWINPYLSSSDIKKFKLDSMTSICDLIEKTGFDIQNSEIFQILPGLKQGEYVMIENSFHNKSVQAIQHVQIFIKKNCPLAMRRRV